MKIVFLIVLFTSIIIWFTYVFTGNAKNKFNKMIVFSYFFPFIFLGGMFMFAVFTSTFYPEDGALNSPIGLVRGCSQKPSAPPNSDLPYGIRCKNASDQWLVNIGGKVLNKQEIDQQKSLDEKKSEQELKESSTTNQQKSAATDTQKSVVDSSFSERTSFIQGGLVVPFYIVVIAVFGGAVSMLRRVPEYQARHASNSTDMLSHERVRESLVFQIMQVFTAPIIAITAFYIFDPNSKASSLSLAFFAGFSSETILMLIRSFVEKLRPETTRDLPKVEVTPDILDFGKVSINTSSTPKIVTLTNRSNTVISGSISALAAFSCTPNVAFTVQPNNTLSISVLFKPTTAGEQHETLQIKMGDSGSLYEVHLSGTGV